MIYNYVKIALRNYSAHKNYFLVNLSGLAVGIGCCLLILLYIRFEFSYDKYHEKHERIFRLESERRVGANIEKLANVPFPAGPAVAREFPEIIESVRLFKATNGASVQHWDNLFAEKRFYFSDPNVFDVFSFEFLVGDSRDALSTPKSIVITERMANKYFGRKEVVGQTLVVRVLGRSMDFAITGVVYNPPPNSHFQFDFLVPFESELNLWNSGEPRWDSGILGTWTYLLLESKDDARKIESKLPAFVQTNVSEPASNQLAFSIRALTDIHLTSHRIGELGSNVSINQIYIFSTIAILVLFIACINFTNLTIAQYFRRAKEVGVRKAIGAQKLQLVQQFLGEALLTCLLAIILSVGIIELILPTFNSIAGTAIELNLFNDLDFWLITAGIWIISGLLAGSYPALFLSRTRPAQALKGSLALHSHKGSILRASPLIGQFAVSMILVVVLWTINDQLAYIKDKALGFSKEHLIVITAQSEVDFPTFKNELKTNPGILGATVTARVPAGRHLSDGLFHAGDRNDDSRVQVPFLKVEKDFVQTLDLTLLDGRDFMEGDDRSIIISKAAKQELGLHDSPLGSEIVQRLGEVEKVWTVIGIVEDVHFESLHSSVKPLILGGGISHGSRIIVRISPMNVNETVEHIQTTWAKLNSASPIQFYFMEDNINRSYIQESRLGMVVNIFTWVTLFVTCIGLFGLVSLSSENRRKEVGIRKVLGASAPGIVSLLSKQMMWQMLIAFVFAAPIAALITNKWLQGFAYRVDISVHYFLFAGFLAVFIALLTVSTKIIKVALTNPVDVLRCD